MNALLLMALVRLQTVLLEEQGQDLIEYVLVSALIALGATAGMTTLATAINSAFANLATTFTSAL
jgi:pilus assembly protein Flp/PilA